MQGKEEDQHACGGVSAVMPCPVVVDVLEKRWIEDLNLCDKERKFHNQTEFVVAAGLGMKTLQSLLFTNKKNQNTRSC